MDSGIPALVIGAIFLLGASFLARSSIGTYDLLGARIKEVEARSGEQARTRLTVVSTNLDAGRDTLTLELRNDGQVSLARFDRMDVIVSYFRDTNPTVKLNVWLPYVTGTPSANTWGVTAIAGDTFEPGFLNPGETATIVVELSPKVKKNTTNVIVIATETGVTVSAMFTG